MVVDFFEKILSNEMLVIAAISWLVAGIIKVIIEFIINKKLDVKRVFGAGGMPSSHTSTVVALTVAVGRFMGLNSAEFAIVVIITIIVIHDAVGVRQETGKQSKLLNEMIVKSDSFKNLDFEKQLKEYVGHTPLQTLAGAIVGLAVSTFMIYFIYK